jgi:hypothetical protein
MTATYTLRPQPAVTTTDSPTIVSTEAAQTSPYGAMIAVLPEAVEVDHVAGAGILDRAARRKLGISGDEFIVKWDRGDYAGEEENVRAQEVAMLLPFVRPTPLNAR